MKKTFEQLQSEARQGFGRFVQDLAVVAEKLNTSLEMNDVTEESVEFILDGIPFTLTWDEKSGKSLGEREYNHVEYTLCLWYQTSGTRHEPPESIDKTLIQTRSLGDCIKKAFVAIRENAIDCILEGEYWAQHFEEEKKRTEQI